MTQNPTLSEREEIARLVAPKAFKQAAYAHDWNRRHHPEDGVWGAFAQAGSWLGTVQEAFDTADAILARRAPVAPAEPVAPVSYRYLYPDQMGGQVWRFETGGREINGSRPIRSEPVYATPAQPSTVTADGWKLVPVDDGSRDYANSALPQAMIDAGMAVCDQRDADNRNYVAGETTDWDDGMHCVAIYRAMLDAAPAPPATSPVTGALVEAAKKALRTLRNGDLHEITRVVDAQDILAAALAAQKAEG